jgi:hypothetical protein
MATRTRAAPRRSSKRAPSRAKRAPARASTAARKTTVAAIVAILRQLLDPHGIYPVVLTNPIGDYIRGDRGALRAFFDVANRAFRDYGLNLKPGNLANVRTVQNLVDVIANWFQRRGQLVT